MFSCLSQILREVENLFDKMEDMCMYPKIQNDHIELGQTGWICIEQRHMYIQTKKAFKLYI